MGIDKVIGNLLERHPTSAHVVTYEDATEPIPEPNDALGNA